MTGNSRPYARIAPALLGVLIGALVVVLTLSTAPPPGIPWPAASQVEDLGSSFTPRGTAGEGVPVLAADCTTMLVDVNSNVSTNVWAAPHGTPIDFNATSFPAPFYYWSGSIPVEHLSVVVTVSNPSMGISLTFFDPSYNQSGHVSFGFAFSASDCP
jgi:hypothetical protein